MRPNIPDRIPDSPLSNVAFAICVVTLILAVFTCLRSPEVATVLLVTGWILYWLAMNLEVEQCWKHWSDGRRMRPRPPKTRATAFFAIRLWFGGFFALALLATGASLGKALVPATAAAVSVGFAAWMMATKGSGMTAARRCAFAVVGLGGAAAAWWFVPSIHGLSRWSAHRQADRLLDRLASLSPTQVTEFMAIAGGRTALESDYPDLQTPLLAAEKAWANGALHTLQSEYSAELLRGDGNEARRRLDDLERLVERGFLSRRTIDNAVDSAARGARSELSRRLAQLPLDDPAELSRLRGERTALVAAHPEWADDFWTQEFGWAGRRASWQVSQALHAARSDFETADNALREALRTLAELFKDRQGDQQWPAIRRSLVAARIDALRIAARETWRRTDNAGDAARLVAGHASTLAPAVAAVGLADDLRELCDTYAVIENIDRVARMRP